MSELTSETKRGEDKMTAQVIQTLTRIPPENLMALAFSVALIACFLLSNPFSLMLTWRCFIRHVVGTVAAAIAAASSAALWQVAYVNGSSFFTRPATVESFMYLFGLLAILSSVMAVMLYVCICIAWTTAIAIHAIGSYQRMNRDALLDVQRND